MLGFFPISAAPISGIGNIGINAAASITQADNTTSADASVLVLSNTSVTQSDNTASADASIIVTVNSTVTQDDNTLSAAGTVDTAAILFLSVQQDDNTAYSAASVLIEGDMDASLAGDSLVGYIIPGILKHSVTTSLSPSGTNSPLVPHTKTATLH